MYSVTHSVWYTEDGTRVDYKKTFESNSLSDLGYMKIHHWHRRFLEPAISIDPKNNPVKWRINYAPVMKVMKHNKLWGYYEFWNCNIHRYDSSSIKLFESDKEYRLKVLNTPKKYWPYDPESLTYKNTYKTNPEDIARRINRYENGEQGWPVEERTFSLGGSGELKLGGLHPPQRNKKIEVITRRKRQT
jgi:hypothetical protein